MMCLGKLKLCTKFEVASFSRCRNIKGEALISGSSLSPGPHPLLLLVGFDDGGKPQLLAKFEVAGFICYGNIRKSVFKGQIRFLSHPLGVRGNVRTLSIAH